MKKIFFILLLLSNFSTVTICQPAVTVKNQKIAVQPANSNLSAAVLESSAGIISVRLKSFGIDNFVVTVDQALKQVVVNLPDDKYAAFAAKLATQKGLLEFYETWNYNSIAGMMDAAKLSSLLGAGVPAGSSAELGCIAASKVGIVNDYLKTTTLENKCSFLWNDLFNEAEVCLYAVKMDNGKGTRLNGTDIQSINTVEGKPGDQGYLDLKFKQEVVGQWAEITRQNIGNAIAIVLDKKVVFAPVLKSVINGGNCRITGKFSPDQLKYLAAISANGELPSGFNLVK